ncbi:MAG: hypothetical protein L0H93_04800, partial [Nocardioides sp.]|nr:hypothetical protein [Nocardioides sp.]
MRLPRALIALPSAAVLVGGLIAASPADAASGTHSARAANTSATATATAAEKEFPTYGSGLRVRADATTQSAVVSTLETAETISVDCQREGENVPIEGGSSSWWAHVPDKGGYVSVAFVDIPESKLPDVPECTDEPDPEPDPAGEVTYDDLVAMFSGKVGDRATVEDGLPTLNAAMADAGIDTAPRQAAFLATLANESTFLYNIVQSGGATYTGRGYIQLTGDFNYEAAGNDLGVDLLGNPDLAASLDYSAPIARWYWTVARDINPLADALDMGGVDAAIGYAPDPAEDVERCDDFKS